MQAKIIRILHPTLLNLLM